MDTSAVIESAGVYGGTYLVCVASGVIPVINAELFLIGLILLIPSSHALWLIVLLATLGQMTAKIAMYYGGRGVLRIPMGNKYKGKLKQWQGKFAEAEGKTTAFLFTSAFTGLPPFFVTSVLAGTFRFAFWKFMGAGSAGRGLRFAICVVFPHAVKGYL